MAIIIETCPKCGHDLINEMICTYPPIPRKSCPSCGWSWEGEQEEVVRIPFGGNSFNCDDTIYTLQDNTNYECINGDYSDLTTSTSTFGSNLISKESIVGNINIMGDFEQPACVNCPNNIKNGGDGICGCILGQVPVT